MKRFAPTAVALGAGGLLVAALFFGGGSDTDRLLPVALAALFLAGAVLVSSFGGLVTVPSLSPAGIGFVVLMAAFVVWSGLSVAWSFAPDLSWNYFNRELSYLAFCAVGISVGAVAARPLRLVASGMTLLLAALVVCALAGKVFPSLVSDGDTIPRLHWPVGYWNALALLAATALVLGLWVTTDRGRSRLARAAGAVLVYASIVAVLLSYSRSGVGIALLGAAAWALLSGAVLEALATLAVAGVVAAPVVAFVFLTPGLSDAGQRYSVRVHEGALFAPALIGGALVVGAAAMFLARIPEVSARAQRFLVRGTFAVVVLAACAAVALVAARGHEFSAPSASPGAQPRRLVSLSSTRRWTWWKEAWSSFEDAPAIGRGADSFPIVHRLKRDERVVVTQPHNLLLQSLSDTGVIGFLLLGGAIAAAGVAGSARIRRSSGPERLAAVALTIAAGAYVVQALIDVDWDFVAVTGPAFFLAGVLVTTGARRLVSPGWALGGTALACAAAASFLIPWLATRKTEDAYAALAHSPARAARDAEQASSLDPLSVEPLYALALAREQQGRPAAAELAYARAVRLQPHNPGPWYELGVFELRARRKRFACALALHAQTLDHFDTGIADLARRAC